MPVYEPEIYNSVKKDLQYVDTGDIITDPTLHRGIPTNPTFALFGANQFHNVKMAPVTYGRQGLTDKGPTSYIKTRDVTSIDYDFDLTDASVTGILEWLCAMPLAYPDWNSKYVFATREPKTTEYVNKYLGCFPSSTTITFTTDGKPVHINGTLAVSEPLAEDTTLPVIGAGAFAPANSAAMIVPSDGGADSFTYDAVTYKTAGMTINITPVYDMVESDDSDFIDFAAPFKQQVTGSVNIYKKTGVDVLKAEVFGALDATMERILLAGTSKLVLNDVRLTEHVDDRSSVDIPAGTIIPYPFEASELALAASA